MKADAKYLVSFRTCVHFILTFAGMTVYGGQVCPFIVTLSYPGWSAIVFTGVAGAFAIRYMAMSRILATAPVSLWSRWQFICDIAVFALAGACVGMFNWAAFGFPIGASGLKPLLGFSTFGIFFATDLALEREHRIAVGMPSDSKLIDPETHYFSFPKKVVIFFSVIVVYISIIMGFLVFRDIEYIGAESSLGAIAQVKRAVMTEISFVSAALIAMFFNLFISYGRNARYLFERQKHALAEVTNGNLDTGVPVATNDEFGVIAKRTNVMIETLRQRTAELENTQSATIIALASLAETRDNETGAHIIRTQHYIKILAERLRKKGRHGELLDDDSIKLLYQSAPLHDIGKVGIPDNILLKPGKLTPEEFEIMKTHTFLGESALESAGARLGANSFLRYACQIALNHHEKWDGSGYPNGISGQAIPLEARLMAIADVYDALISRRVYKEPFSHNKAKRIIMEGRGAHFDPEVVGVFLEAEDEFKAVASRFPDTAK